MSKIVDENDESGDDEFWVDEQRSMGSIELKDVPEAPDTDSFEDDKKEPADEPAKIATDFFADENPEYANTNSESPYEIPDANYGNLGKAKPVIEKKQKVPDDEDIGLNMPKRESDDEDEDNQNYGSQEGISAKVSGLLGQLQFRNRQEDEEEELEERRQREIIENQNDYSDEEDPRLNLNKKKAPRPTLVEKFELIKNKIIGKSDEVLNPEVIIPSELPGSEGLELLGLDKKKDKKQKKHKEKSPKFGLDFLDRIPSKPKEQESDKRVTINLRLGVKQWSRCLLEGNTKRRL